MAASGRDVLIEVLRSEGVTHVFGNPGTTELPVIDALGGSDLTYVLALQETVAVGMADGYAQVTRRPAFVNLHTTVGLGNAMGSLVNARANNAPLVITAGQQDTRHLFADPMLSGDLVGLAGPVARWSHEVRNLVELGTVLRRAFHDAATEPAGPIFVALPMDILDAVGEAPVPPLSNRDLRTVPTPDALQHLAALIAEAAPAELAVVAGDEVARYGAVPALCELAQLVGARVHGSPFHSRTVFPTDHPLWAGPLRGTAQGIRETLSRYRRVLLLGGQAFMPYLYTPGSAMPDGVELIHVSPDATQIGRTHPAAFGVTGDPRSTLEALLPLLGSRVDSRSVENALAAATKRRTAAQSDLDAEAAAAGAAMPASALAVVHGLLRTLPSDVPVVDEAITASSLVRRLHRASAPDRYFACRAGGLGWGMPAALGVSLGRGGEPVLCVVGDGAAMYAPQALWTAAHQGLPVVFAVLHNHQYRILKQGLLERRGQDEEPTPFPGVDLVHPAVDFTALAASLGVKAARVEDAREVPDALVAALGTGRPHLLELPVASPV